MVLPLDLEDMVEVAIGIEVQSDDTAVLRDFTNIEFLQYCNLQIIDGPMNFS